MQKIYNPDLQYSSILNYHLLYFCFLINCLFLFRKRRSGGTLSGDDERSNLENDFRLPERLVKKYDKVTKFTFFFKNIRI